MLLAVRRYRIFLLVAALAAVSVYYLSGGRPPKYPETIGVVHDSKDGDESIVGIDKTEEKVIVPDLDAALPKRPNLELFGDSDRYALLKGESSQEGETGKQTAQDYRERIQARPGVGKERFPIADKDIIGLPSNEPKALPKIQFAFDAESATAKQDRIKKQTIIRKSFLHAWNGYKQYAMGHDELKPLTKTGINQTQFMGWGATLVDSLDTLWIMGLKEDFDDAVKQVAKISFKTSNTEKVPLFETVIRYLGGLISAHDLSSGKQPILLNKAIELADVLMGAFDTPNRMPIPYYYWKGSDSLRIPLSHNNTVLAELGSLSLEFTRLAQITQKNKYYDAVARITNALEKFQSETRMPGLWPLRLDSSGCKDITKPSPIPVSERPEKVETPIEKHVKDPYDHDDLHNVPETKAEPPKQIKDPYDHPELDNAKKSLPPPTQQLQQKKPSWPQKRALFGRQLQEFRVGQDQVPGCEPQGLRHEPNAIISFGIGGLADSVYEYMPKMHALLGGQNKQYRTMYDYAIKTVKDHLLFRPMIEDEKRSILFASRLEYNLNEKDTDKQKSTIWEATHLACFAGGMMGIASRLFDNQKDLEIAKKLTDGCVWAYESTPSGVMPETFNIVPCDSQNSCPWDEKRWHQILDFGMQNRLDAASAWTKKQEEFSVEKSEKPSGAGDADADVVTPSKPVATLHKGGIKKVFEKKLEKRAGAAVEDDVDDADSEDDGPVESSTRTDQVPIPTQVKGKASEDDQEPADEDEDLAEEIASTKATSKTTSDEKDSKQKLPIAAPLQANKSSPKASQTKTTLSHGEYVAARIREERLPSGYTSIFDRSYKLRPEAIESVFIMWRLTGDEYWREKGWTMFQSIQHLTMTEVGNAAVSDVTSVLGANRDSMESFWLAETLKYFYLLFSEPDLISLDDYVFNTEAHPFKIPKSKSSA